MKINKDKNIVLIGYMGCGKSTVGRKAAKAVDYTFIDTDTLIEKEEGMSTARIFEEKGEGYFRNKETEIIKRLIDGEKGNIIATGGGLPMAECNRPLLKEIGTVIYLKAEQETLLRRLSNDKVRPLLKNVNLKEKIETMLEIRGPVYESCADVVLQADKMTFYEIICHIEKILRTKTGGSL